MATSSPMAVKTMTSAISYQYLVVRVEQLMLTGVLLLDLEELLDLLADLTLWNLDVVLGGTVIRHERQETIVGDVELLWTSAFIICLFRLDHSRAGIPCG
jgi:hypothetical protein